MSKFLIGPSEVCMLWGSMFSLEASVDLSVRKETLNQFTMTAKFIENTHTHSYRLISLPSSLERPSLPPAAIRVGR